VPVCVRWTPICDLESLHPRMGCRHVEDWVVSDHQALGRAASSVSATSRKYAASGLQRMFVGRHYLATLLIAASASAHRWRLWEDGLSPALL
jgi:hypothetical protein